MIDSYVLKFPITVFFRFVELFVRSGETALIYEIYSNLLSFNRNHKKLKCKEMRLKTVMYKF